MACNTNRISCLRCGGRWCVPDRGMPAPPGEGHRCTSPGHICRLDEEHCQDVCGGSWHRGVQRAGDNASMAVSDSPDPHNPLAHERSLFRRVLAAATGSWRAAAAEGWTSRPLAATRKDTAQPIPPARAELDTTTADVGLFWDCSRPRCRGRRRALPQSSGPGTGYVPPLDPSAYGGPSAHKERMWLTAAASDSFVSDWGVGSDCGSSCFLVRNPTANSSAWTAVVAVLGRCSDIGRGDCHGQRLLFAVPGHQIPGDRERSFCNQTTTASQSVGVDPLLCSDSSSAIDSCRCDSMPESTLQEQAEKVGCKVFSSWAWATATPALDVLRRVECPSSLMSVIGADDAPPAGDKLGPGDGASPLHEPKRSAWEGDRRFPDSGLQA
eukprot:CAMPEP_0117656842 /NCGR_PEP_ID=MMETSP0804-20121206/5017_1 /TAXON_ID=1074897 /ORGANISM="Tetraselmis astigmatica, Strain CCMP880" /LENGTH=381 /DNA_ID=CAMNT_0005463265 /DNA_START=148 /DNA_END=1294 /DNA_ORIENTATION=-